MKTSKRILSFFLAVVMVVTTCSVGFTAFAAENKTDSNNAYWNDATQAEDAFAALNDLVDTYLPALLNIEAVKGALEGMGMTVTEDTTISDVLAAISPMLVSALGGSASTEEVLGNNDAMNKFRYGYLDGDGNDAMSFYQLYSFCQSFSTVDAGDNEVLQALKAYATETLPKLQDLVDVYSEYAADAALGDVSSLVGIVMDAVAVEAQNLISQGMDAGVAQELAMVNVMSAKPEAMGNFKLSIGLTINEYTDDVVESCINYYGTLFESFGSSTKIETTADLCYYFVTLATFLGIDFQSGEIMLYLANQAGTPYTTEAIGGTANDVLTNANFFEKISAIYTMDMYLAENGLDEAAYASQKSYHDLMYTARIYAYLNACVYDVDAGYGAIGSSKYRDLCIAVLDIAGIYSDARTYVDSLIITDEQINSIMAIASAEGWSNSSSYIDGYIGSADCVLSAQAKTIISYFSTYDRAMLAQALATNDIDKVKAVKSTDGSAVYGQMNLIDRVNFQIPSIVCIENFGTNYNLSSPSRTIDVCKVYLAINECQTISNAIEEDGVSYDYDDYRFKETTIGDVTVTENDIMVYAANHTLNDLVLSVLNPDGMDLGGFVLNVNAIISSILTSEVDLYNLVKDLWLNLYNQPIETIFNLLPTLVIALDELILPMVLNGEGDVLYNTLYGLIAELLGDITQETGDTSVGLGTLSFDLNKILPAILHWLAGDKQFAIDLVGTYTGDVYDNNIPMFLNIYVVDKALYGLDLEALINSAGLEEDLAAGLNEAISTVLGTLMGAVDAFVADHGEDARYNPQGEVSQRGLNNIFVALPQLMDYIGQAFIDKYNVNSDWTAYYEGKFVEVTNEASGVTEIQNATLNNFKGLATANDPDAVLDQFVNALIGNWLNSLLDFVNDLVSDTDNKIAAELPLVFNLLNALGGFGEKSIISDLLNGLFQLKRSDVASFGLTEQEETGFVGFSNESGFFLLSNLSFTSADGEARGLIPLIMNLINGNSSADYDINNAIKATSSSGAKTVAPYAASVSATGTNYSELLSAENVDLAESLVDTLDELLASLLENTSLNGFTLNSTDNILSSVVALAATAIGQDNASDLVKLLDNYVYYVVGESNATPNKDGKIGTTAKNGDVNDKKVYTSANLSNLVIQTYSLIENIVDYLFYNADSGFLKADKDMLIADAIAGIISPDSVGVRMSDDYSATAEILAKEKYLNWNDFKVEITAVNEAGKDYKATDYLKYGFSAGDKDEFYTALAESLGGITAILGAVLASPYGADTTDTLYSTVLYPVLNGIAAANGVSAMAPAAFANADNASRLVDGLLRPLSETLACVYDAPISMLLNTVKGLASVLEDDSIKAIVGGVDGLVNGIIGGAFNIVGFASPTLADYLGGLVSINIALDGDDIVVNLINDLLGGAVELPAIDWTKLANAGSPAETLLLVYGYLVDFILGSDLLSGLLEGVAPELMDIIQNLTATEILTILNEVIQLTQSPTEIYWTFSQYAAKITGSFAYPLGISASEANEAVDQLDQLVANIFPLLKELGVLDAENLSDLVNGALYTNSLLTTLTKGLYGALCSEVAEGMTIADILKVVGIDPTPAGIAAYLTDKDYGKTYSSAAATLKKAKSWNDVKELNWGFTDGSAKAQQGFINGLAAALRPLNNILSLFLAEGQIDFNGVDLAGLLSTLNIKISDTANIKNGVLTVKFGLDDPAANVLKIDLGAIAKDIDSMLEDGKLALGTNGYENAIIPLLEAFCIDDVKTYKEYKSDYNKAKDNLLINILEPLFGFVNEVIEAPFDTLTGVLPNVGLFIDGGGITQLVNNLLAPIVSDNGLVGVLDAHGINIDELIEAIAGDDLGGILGNALGIDGLKLKLTDLEESNLHDILIPLVNSLLASTGIELPEIDWKQLASHGTVKTIKSAAKNADGTYKTMQIVDVNKGETLIAVLRYIEAVLVNNASALKDLLGGLLGDNATVKNIVNSIFTNIGLADEDDLVIAVFYFLTGDFTNRYFDYRDFTAGEDIAEFSWGSLDEDFCRQLAPMLDGLIGGLIDLNGLVSDNLYKDSLISTIVVGLGKALEGVTISGDTKLDDLLALTDIDYTTEGIAAVLVNEDYGQSYEDAANTIKNAGSWANVNQDSLMWGVTDRDSFLHALCAVFRPFYGVIDVLFNNGRLNLFDLVSLPGSDGYTSTVVPLMEALSMYNIKTQYQYREDIYNEYDAILLDILNPVFDWLEDLLAAPIQTLAGVLPNLALVFGNDGLIQIVDNLLTPVSALLAAIQPIVDVNELLGALGLDIPKELAKIGIALPSDYEFNIYDLPATLTPLVGAENVVPLLNGILGSLDINGTKLGLVLPEINWFQLASHGELITDGTSQVACYGKRIYVVADQDETLLAVLRFLVNTINYADNYNAIVNLIGGLLGGADDTISGVVEQVLGMLQGDADEVITNLVDLLQTLAG